MLRLRMNGTVSAAMRKSGLDYKLNFGLDASSIREIAARHQPNELLAEKLWQENSRECKILATLLYPKSTFTTDHADRWLEDCFLLELTEQLCFNLLQHLDFSGIKATEWIQSSDIKQKIGGYTLALRLLLRKQALANLNELLNQAKVDLHSENYQLKLSASRFLERGSLQEIN